MKVAKVSVINPFICGLTLFGSIIFACPDHFVGLSVLCSYWSFIVHMLGDTAEIG